MEWIVGLRCSGRYSRVFQEITRFRPGRLAHSQPKSKEKSETKRRVWSGAARRLLAASIIGIRMRRKGNPRRRSYAYFFERFRKRKKEDDQPKVMVGRRSTPRFLKEKKETATKSGGRVRGERRSRNSPWRWVVRRRRKANGVGGGEAKGARRK